MISSLIKKQFQKPCEELNHVVASTIISWCAAMEKMCVIWRLQVEI